MSYTNPVIVDVTWWAELNGDSVPLRDAVREIVLRLYSMLRRHVDPAKPTASAGEIVVRPGVGIPVSLGRPMATIAAEINRERAAAPQSRTLRVIVPILDGETYGQALRSVRGPLESLIALASAGDEDVLVFPVTLDSRWDQYFMDAAPVRLAWVANADRAARAASGVATNLARALMARERGRAGDPAPHVTIFVSHAKVDLRDTDFAAVALNRYLQNDTELSTFFDVKEIQRGGEIAHQLVAAQRQAVLLALRTDHYADSAWCHQEVLTAKALQVPVISVWAVRHEERRALPYGGNMPTLVWDEQHLDVIADRCLEAWLHHLHFQRAAASALALTPRDRACVFISRPPELVDFALGGLPVDRKTLVLYPDPPLPAAETRVLRLAHPRVRLATPTTLFGGAVWSDDPAPPLAGRLIALSLSESPAASPAALASNTDGFNALHVEDVSAHLTLCVVRAGARLAYGGHLQPDGFTPFLADIIGKHNALGAGRADIPLIFLASYLRDNRSAIDVEQRLEGADIAIDDVAGVTARAGKALQLRAMRIAMASACDARVAVGGKDREYAGRFPGIVEECWRMLEAGKPIYPVAGFGGATRLLAEALLGHAPPGLREAGALPELKEMFQAYDADPRRLDSRGDQIRVADPASLDELAARLAVHGEILAGANPDARWSNGLTVRENLRLFETRDPTEIAYLVMKGLAIALGRAGAPTDAGPALRLFRGSLSDLEAVDAYAVPVVSGLAPTGAAAAIDERLAGRIARRLERPIREIEALNTNGARLAGRTVVLVPLGSMEDSLFQQPGERVQEACAALARYIRENPVTSLAVVPFGGNVGLQVSGAVDTLLRELKDVLAGRALIVCETVPDRYDEIKQGLAAQRGYTELPPAPAVAPTLGIARSPLTIAVSRTAQNVTVTLLPPAEDSPAVVARVVRGVTDAELTKYAVIARAPDFAELDSLGLALGRDMLGGDLLNTIANYPDNPIDVVHDAATAAVPWELLAFMRKDVAIFPAREAGMRRRLVLEREVAPARPRRLEPGGQLRVLLVVCPDNLPAARGEAETIKAGFKRHAQRIELSVLESAAATVDAVARALGQRWDVLHYAGHAAFDPANPGSSGLRLTDGWFTAAALRNAAATIPPLVVLNACTSGRVRDPDESVEPTPTPGLAETILVAGARTFIGTFWRVKDGAAAAFADELYRCLLAGKTVGGAVLSARRALADDRDPDWTNYNLYGDTELHW